jgi:hypothetical protein
MAVRVAVLESIVDFGSGSQQEIFHKNQNICPRPYRNRGGIQVTVGRKKAIDGEGSSDYDPRIHPKVCWSDVECDPAFSRRS